MNARRMIVLSFSVLSVAAGCLSFSSASALGAFQRHYLSQLTGFGNPTGLAIDSSSKLYVADRAAKTVDELDSSGAPLAFTEPESYVEGSKLTGTPSGPFLEPQGVAVDDTSGDIYVSDSGAHVVDVFKPGGEYVSQLTGTPATAPVSGPFSYPYGLAVDQVTHNLYVADPHNGVIDVFNSGGAYERQFGSGILSGQYAESVAVNDLTENAYVGDSGEVAVDVFEPLGTFLPPAWHGAGTHDGSFGGQYIYVGADQSTGHVYVADTAHKVVSEFEASASEEFVSQVSGGSAGPFARPQALAVDRSSHNLYVADGNGVIDVFGPDTLLPDVAEEVPSNIGVTSTTVKGTVNPLGVPITSCQFEYGTDTTYGESIPCTQTPAQIGAGSNSVPVSATLTGLSPNTTYHVRLSAGNANGRNYSAEETFRTVGPPTIEDESTSEVGSSSATLNALISPEANAATYHFEYGPTVAYGSRTATVNIGSSQPEAVRVRLEGLEPDTAYHFRLVAQNEYGDAQGADSAFATYPRQSMLGLPDGRGYEIVTPPANEDAETYVPQAGPLPQTEEDGFPTDLPFQASAGGDAVTYLASPTRGGNGSEGNGGGNQYVARRSAGGGWSQVNIQPAGYIKPAYEAFSADLSTAILHSNESLVSGVPNELNNLYTSGTTGAGIYRPFFTSNYSGEGYAVEIESQDVSSPLQFAGASSDFNHLLFEGNVAFSASTPLPSNDINNLYDSVDGQPILVNVLPDGTPQPNATFGSPWEGYASGGPDLSHVISTDGSRIFWTDLNTGNLYVRENDDTSAATTVEVDAAVGGGGRFWTASADGSRVIFTKGDLYEYDLRNGATTDLTPGAAVQGVLGASEDGSYIYFVSGAALAPGAVPQSCDHGTFCNLYVHRDGGPAKFIAKLAFDDGKEIAPVGPGAGGFRYGGDWIGSIGQRTARVTPDGQGLVFMSSLSLTAYPNHAQATEVYLYHATAGHLTCVSCSPSGEERADVAAGNIFSSSAFVPITYGPTYMTRSISDDGSRVFFDSPQPLVASDTNAKQDVYEWERDGSGSCRRDNGCIYLLSGGSSLASSWLLDASASGDDVFIITRAQLVPQDRNENYDVYDARVGAVRPLSPPACSGTGCQGVPPAPPIFATPSSVTFSGVGNYAPPPGKSVKQKGRAKPARCKRGSVKRHGKCARKRAKKSARRSK